MLLSPAEIVALLVAVSFAAGLNVYATVATLGLLGRTGLVELPGHLAPVADWWVIGIAGALWALEFVADKVPLFDVIWNVGQAFIRVPVSAVIAYVGAAPLGPGWQLAASAMGAAIAALAASGKTAARASVAPSPEPISNILLSLAEDAAAVALTWFATAYPLLAASIALFAAIVIAALLRTVVRQLRIFVQRAGAGRSVTRT
jgi:hypothetical protein